jgi:hypothetical protein
MYVVCQIYGDKASCSKNAMAFDRWTANKKEQTVGSLFLEIPRREIWKSVLLRKYVVRPLFAE